MKKGTPPMPSRPACLLMAGDGFVQSFVAESGPNLSLVEPEPGTDLDESRLVADIDRLLEIGREQGLDGGAGAPAPGRVGNQAMRCARVRRPLHAVEGEADALLLPQRGHVAIERGGPVRPELAGSVDRALHALRRHAGIELEGQPADGRRESEARFVERALEAALADEAPRTDDVREDVDGEGSGHSGSSRWQDDPSRGPWLRKRAPIWPDLIGKKGRDVHRGPMIHRILVSSLALAGLVQPASAMDLKARLDLEPLIVKHAAANNIPAGLVHRIIIRESRYNARAVGLGGALGLMQIKHATARALGYSGSAEGLLDADTNLTYGVRYLAGAYRVADGDQNRAVGFYARGYYYDAKRRGMLGTLARAPAVAQEPAAAVAAPPPAPPQSFFSTLFSSPQPAPPAAQAAIEQPEAVVAAPRTKRAGKRQAADVETGRSAPAQGEQRGEAVQITGGTVAAPVAGVGPRAMAAKETAALPEAAAPPREAAINRSGRPAKRTTVSGADRSAQKASAQPDDPGTNP